MTQPLLKGSHRRILRAQAHGLNPLVLIGAKGLTDQLIDSVDAALQDHELIKVKFNAFKDDKKAFAARIAKATRSELVGLIGHIAIYYRQHVDPEKRKIAMP